MDDLPFLNRARVTRRRLSGPLVAQCGALALGFGVLALAPPASGAMLLLPLMADPGEVVDVALAHGARLLGAGPLPGSIVVTGRRDGLAGAMLRHGTLVMAAAPLLCGTPDGMNPTVRS